MKIGDITAGQEYGISDDRQSDPRRVEALSVVVVTEQEWNANLEKHVPRERRKVEVKYLDTPARRGYGVLAKGAKRQVLARDLIAPWKQLGPGIQKRTEERLAREAASDVLDKRLKKLLGRNPVGNIYVRDNGEASLSLYGKYVEKLLDLAEKGKEAVG